MDWKLPPLSALDYFACLVAQEEPLPLLEAAVCIAQDAHPDLDVQQVLFDVDVLVGLLRKRIPWGASGMQRTYILNEFFYEKLGFAVNANDFTDPRNSYIHSVLERRRGIPITLAVLWLEMATAIGIHAEGVSFPGHFLIKVHVDEGIIIQDPLTGRGLSQSTLSEWLEPFHDNTGLREEEQAPLELFLQPCASRDILERMLRNLRLLLGEEQGGHQELLLKVLDRLLVLCPNDWQIYRDRGLVEAQRGNRAAALQDLLTYVRKAQAPQDLFAIEARIESLRAAI